MASTSVATLRRIHHTLRSLGVALDPVQRASTQGLIGAERKSARAISTTTQTPYHSTILTRHLGTQDELTLAATHALGLVRAQPTLVNHPDGGLVCDATALAQEGPEIEAVSRGWDTAAQRVIWGHELVVVGVAPPQGLVPVLARSWLPSWAYAAPTQYQTETDYNAGTLSEGVGMFKSGKVTVMVSDVNRAVQFYTKTPGLTLTGRASNEWVEVEAPGLTIGLHLAGERGPQPGQPGSPPIDFREVRILLPRSA